MFHLTLTRFCCAAAVLTFDYCGAQNVVCSGSCSHSSPKLHQYYNKPFIAIINRGEATPASCFLKILLKLWLKSSCTFLIHKVPILIVRLSQKEL